MSYILANRIAVVTGGESGIGAACVAVLAAQGANIGVIYYTDEEHGAASAETARRHGRMAHAVQADVGDEAAVEAAFDEFRKKIGLPNILVNSAGVNMSGVNVVDMELAQWERVIGTDLTGSFLTSRRFARDLVKAGREGTIINITSIHASVMSPGGADYCAAKGGQRNLTETMALELAEHGITVNAIAPGMILTPMNEEAMEDEEHRRSMTRNIPLKRAGQPEEVAELAAYLASPAARYITGASLTIDGALSLLLGQGA